MAKSLKPSRSFHFFSRVCREENEFHIFSLVASSRLLCKYHETLFESPTKKTYEPQRRTKKNFKNNCNSQIIPIFLQFLAQFCFDSKPPNVQIRAECIRAKFSKTRASKLRNNKNLSNLRVATFFLHSEIGFLNLDRMWNDCNIKLNIFIDTNDQQKENEKKLQLCN